MISRPVTSNVEQGKSSLALVNNVMTEIEMAEMGAQQIAWKRLVSAAITQ